MASVRFTASQVRSIYQYKNLRIKVLKCCADIFFNPYPANAENMVSS